MYLELSLLLSILVLSYITWCAEIQVQQMASAAEAKLGALCMSAREAASIGNTLEELGHWQPKTPIQTDNTTVVTNWIQYC